MPKGSAIAVGFEWWGPEFEKRTQGRYKVEIYPGASLIGIPAALDSAKAGVAEVVMTSTGTFPKDFPLSLVTSLPTLGFSPNKVEEYSAAYQACWDLYNKFPEIQAEFKDYKLLWLFELDPYNLVSKKKEIHYASDFKGLKVGGTGQKMDMVVANGGASVHQVPPQTYLNLDKGVVDVSFNTFGQVEPYKLHEICNYFYTQDFGSGLIIILMNLEAWNAMSAQDKKIMEDSWADASIQCALGSMAEMENGRKAVVDIGKKLTNPTLAEQQLWTDAAEPVFKTWKDDAIGLGANPKLVDDIFAEWKALRKKYTR